MISPTLERASQGNITSTSSKQRVLHDKLHQKKGYMLEQHRESPTTPNPPPTTQYPGGPKLLLLLLLLSLLLLWLLPLLPTLARFCSQMFLIGPAQWSSISLLLPRYLTKEGLHPADNNETHETNSSMIEVDLIEDLPVASKSRLSEKKNERQNPE